MFEHCCYCYRLELMTFLLTLWLPCGRYTTAGNPAAPHASTNGPPCVQACQAETGTSTTSEPSIWCLPFTVSHIEVGTSRSELGAVPRLTHNVPARNRLWSTGMTSSCTGSRYSTLPLALLSLSTHCCSHQRLPVSFHQGPGSPINWQMAQPLVADLLQHINCWLTRRHCTHPAAMVLRFAHAETVLPLLTALGVGRVRASVVA